MITVTIQGTDMADIQRKVSALFPEPTTQISFDVAAIVPEIKAKKEKKQKAEKVEAAPVVHPPTKEIPSREMIHEILQEVNVEKGLPIAREILTSFSAQRISELKEENFQGFYDKCCEALGK